MNSKVRAAVKDRHTLGSIKAKQAMTKTLKGKVHKASGVTFEVLSTHKGWSLSKAWGLRTYSVQSQGLLQRKVKPHRPMSCRLGRRNGSCVKWNKKVFDMWKCFHPKTLFCIMRQKQSNLEPPSGEKTNNWGQRTPWDSEREDKNMPEELK